MSMALFTAVAVGDQVRAKFLLSRGVRINLKDARGESILVTALHIDHDRRRAKMFKWLLSKGANILTVSKTSGRDLLIWAVSLNRPAEAELILTDAGGELDLRRKDFQGFTALHYGTINDCGPVVESLCRHMRKYDISVDITDTEGLTPYLLARRLGHNACAHILLDVGEACPHKGDEKTAQSQHFWETVGSIERSRQEDAEKSRVAALYKQMGRLPQLRKAGFDTDHIKLVSSDNERKFIEDGKVYRRHGALQPLNLSSFDPNEPMITSRLHADQPRRIPPSMLISIHKEFEKDRFFSAEAQDPHLPDAADSVSESEKQYMSSPRMMNSLLELVSVQETTSFKPAAKRHKPRGSLLGAAQAASFGIKLKRKMTSNRNNRKMPGSGINKDHLPVIVHN